MGTGTAEDTEISKNEGVTPFENQKGDRKPLSNKLKYITAAAIFYGNIAYGCGFTTYGPTITSLQTKYDVDDAKISTVFTILTCGNLLGGLSGGIIYNFLNRQLAVATIFIVMSAVMFVTPHCPTLTTYFISAGVMGFCCGSYDAAQVVWMMEMMQKACPPFVLAQHFFYAVGPILSSLIMAPFLQHDDDDDDEENMTTTVKANDTDEESRLFIPFTIIGCFTALTAVFHILLFIFLRYRPPPPEILDEPDNSVDKLDEFNEKKNEADGGFKIGKWSLAKLGMVVLAAIFAGANQGMEIVTFEFFSKFGQNSDLNLSEKRAAYTLTGLNASFAVFRAIGILAVLKIKPQLIVFGNLAMVVVANVLLIGWANNSLPVLWASGIIFGMGFSTMYPAFYGYLERYLRFTNFIGGLMVVCGAGLSALYPIVIGRFIEEHPVVMSYTVFFSVAMILFSFGTLSYLTHKNKTRY